MSDLRQKLRAAFRCSEPAPPAPPRGELMAGVLRRFQERQRRRGGSAVVELPPGEELRNEHGGCYLRRLHYPLDWRHGGHRLATATTADGARLAELARSRAAPPAAEQCLFLDTETTGLAGGAGTVVFLVGLGYFESDGFTLEQVFLRAFAEEAAALAHLAHRLAERPWLVTFVGKSFDRHRLAARLTMHRIAAPVLADTHLDLYHLTRRAHRELPDTRLRTVERHLLGVERHDDLPGALAPVAFLDWIRDRSGAVDRVLEHNRLDVLSLVTLLGVLGRAEAGSAPARE